MKKTKARPPQKGGGGRLTRTEVTTVRLDLKLRYEAEIASRSQRRTVSSLLEVALAEYLSRQVVITAGHPEGQPLLELVERIWDPDEPERFVKFAQSCGWLLNTEEDRRWKYIQSVLQIHGAPTRKQTDLLREHYETFVKAGRGEVPESVIVKLRLTISGD